MLNQAPERGTGWKAVKGFVYIFFHLEFYERGTVKGKEGKI